MSSVGQCRTGAKTALVKDYLRPLQHLPAASDFLDFLMHKDGRHIPVSLEAFDEVIFRCACCYVIDGKQLAFLSASPFTSMMQEVVIDQMYGNDKDVHVRNA